MKKHRLQGTGVALVTPFNEDNSIDTASLEKLVHYQIENGVDYLVVLGTTAETATLSEEEKEIVKETIKKANNNRLPMVLGIGGNNTQAVINAIKKTDLSGYEAILSVSPYYNKPSQEGIYQHFKAIAESTSHSILLYNVPSRTGSNIEAETTLRLSKNFPNIIGIKEASGNIIQIMKLLAEKKDDFLVISGDDITATPSVLLGADGVISVLAQGLPKHFSEMINFALNNKNTEAMQLQFQLMNAMQLIFKEGNPVGIKSLLNEKQICSNMVRLPLVVATENLHHLIKEFLKNLK
ncbi:MAG: 4-hydroxy-tetrahydrodipicolinate synthase [Capnocytophaga sp.]|nr:4-hydroxy-tetrahydrodipicolinate synthase [Capnocytophaga sp.]